MGRDYRVIVTGSRDWEDARMVFDALNDCHRVAHMTPDAFRLVVVHGACPTGADDWASKWASCGKTKYPDVPVIEEVHPADWVEHGKAAGPIRNKEMVALGADFYVAFMGACVKPGCPVPGLHGSHGTTNCTTHLAVAMIPGRLFVPGEDVQWGSRG